MAFWRHSLKFYHSFLPQFSTTISECGRIVVEIFSRQDAIFGQIYHITTSTTIFYKHIAKKKVRARKRDFCNSTRILFFSIGNLLLLWYCGIVVECTYRWRYYAKFFLPQYLPQFYHNFWAVVEILISRVLTPFPASPSPLFQSPFGLGGTGGREQKSPSVSWTS